MKSPAKQKSFYDTTPASTPLCIGILGGGQLGYMMTQAAHQRGYRVMIYDTKAEAPAFSVADSGIVASFEDREALRRFAEQVDLITLEFENIPLSALTFLETLKPLFPSATAIARCQDRLLEKNFLRSHGFPVAPFKEIVSAASLQKALEEMAAPCILKTTTLGYDGKGQITLLPTDDAALSWQALGTARAILEKKITFSCEASVIIARSKKGETIVCSTQENSHRNGILDYSVFPPRLGKAIVSALEATGKKIAEALELIGLLTVEFFILPDGSFLINELAPRPHNSGHHTLESLTISQFEEAIRAIANVPLIIPAWRSDAVMVNVLGDLWHAGEPDWEPLRGNPHAHLHLYGKKEAAPGRKMGHVTFTGAKREQLLAIAQNNLIRSSAG